MKKFISVLTMCALVLSLMMPMQVKAADNPRWEKEPDREGWTYTDGQGTNLLARIEDDTLYIRGTGAVPSYDKDCLGNRPWHDKPVRTLIIERGVTSIGAEAFSNLRDLRHVTMYVNTFIESPTAFGNDAGGCQFDFFGTDIVSRDVGNVPYNSLDSITAFMQRFNGYYNFTLANYYMINRVQNMAWPKIVNLAPQDALTTYTNLKYPIVDYKSSLEIISQKPEEEMYTYIYSKQQGPAALEVFSLVLGDATYVTAYNMAVTGSSGDIRRTDVPLTYVMTIPAAVQYPGRQFSLIQIGPGVVNILEDEDLSDATLTFTTDFPSTVYALVYRDTINYMLY